MTQIADKKLHFAPFVRQSQAIERLLDENRFRNVTEFLRLAIDHYLDHMGRPPLSEQARQMAEDFHNVMAEGSSRLRDDLQYASMTTDENW